MKLALIIIYFFLLSPIYIVANIHTKEALSPKSTIRIFTPKLISNVVLKNNKDSINSWIKNLRDTTISHIKDKDTKRDILITVSIHPNKEATIDIKAKPKFKNSSIKVIQKDIDIFIKNSPRTLYMDFSFAIIIEVNGGGDTNIPIQTPMSKKIREFKALPLKEKIEQFQKWINDGIIPILAYYETKVDKKFKGVLYVGNILKNRDYIDKNTDDITSKNFNYWRGSMEMELGNQIIPFSKVCIYFTKGKFEKGARLLNTIGLFSKRGTLVNILREIIITKIKYIFADIAKEIEKGIKLHDKGEYKEAIKHYEELLKIMPYVSWLNYEYFYSKTIHLKDRTKEWEKTKKIIYDCDPLYSMSAELKSAKEAYFFTRKQEIDKLFHNRKTLKEDMIKFAQITFDIEYYSLSAEVYKLIYEYYPKTSKKIDALAHFLYSIDKLGIREWKKYFKGDFKKRFKSLEQKKEQRYKNSTAYKMFKNRD